MKILIAVFTLMAALFVTEQAKAQLSLSCTSWTQIATKGTNGFPNQGIGQWPVELGGFYGAPITVGTDTSTGVTTAWVMAYSYAGGTSDAYYNLYYSDDSSGWYTLGNTWTEYCPMGDCDNAVNFQEMLSTGQTKTQLPWYALYGGSVYYPNSGGTGNTEVSGSYNVSHYTVDASNNIYGLLGGSCTNTGVPDGTCIQKSSNYGTTWANMYDSPGAYEVISDWFQGTEGYLWTLGESGYVWKHNLSGGTWSGINNNICASSGGGTLVPVQIATNDGIVFAINQNSSEYFDPGPIYYWEYGTTGSSSCWNYLTVCTEPTYLQLDWITANQTQDMNGSGGAGECDLMGADGDGNLWCFSMHNGPDCCV